MNAARGEIFNRDIFNGWRLFWLITAPISATVVIAMFRTDLSTGAGVSSMIQPSVRCAVPCLYLAFAASSMRILVPGPLTAWWLRNRRIFGLCFAAAMAWQALFIIWLVTVHRDYYIQEVHVLRDVIEGVLGYTFLIAMTLTSFRAGRRRLSPRQWKVLHKVGIYSLWIYAFSVYWWEVFYYPDPDWIDYLYYWSGFLAWGLRAAAWTKKRRQLVEGGTTSDRSPPAYKLGGAVLVGFGMLAVTLGSAWQRATEAAFSRYAFSNWLELYLPYWPFEPYIPLFVILLGAYLTTKTLYPRSGRLAGGTSGPG